MDVTTWIETVEERWTARLDRPRSPRSLTVVFDPHCELCRRCRDWMLAQPTLVDLRFVACTESDARRQFGDIPWFGDELVVVGDDRDVWVGPAAFLICLWALEDWRPWSYRLAGPAFAQLAERFFLLISSRRRRISAFLSPSCSEGVCKR
jgi:predicted DCC family thiol-disulfide oxidoreductase YuxK